METDNFDGIFQNNRPVEAVADGFAKVLSKYPSQKYDYKHFFNLISVFLQKLNIENKHEQVEYFFNEIYKYIPDNEIKFKNIILNEYELATKQTVLKSYPRKIRVELLHNCNISCIMCKLKNDYYRISNKEFNDLIEIMPYLQELKIQGGEVFFDSRLETLLNVAIKYETNIAIITNGLLLNEQILEKLSKLNLELTFSVDSQKKEVYEKIREGAKFEVLLKNLKLSKKYLHNKKIVLNMVVMRSNYSEIENMIEFAGKHKFEEIHLNPVDGDACKEENFWDYGSVADSYIINEIKNKSEKYENIAKQSGIILLNRLPHTEKKIKQEQSVENITDYESDCLSDNKNIGCINSGEDKEMYCYNPFRQMFLANASKYGPNCECIGIVEDKNDYDSEKSNIVLAKWNGYTMQKYREAMIKHKESEVCLKICEINKCSRRNIIY